MQVLEKKLGEFLDKGAQITWTPVIHYRVGPGYSISEYDIDIDPTRFYVATGPDNHPLKPPGKARARHS